MIRVIAADISQMDADAYQKLYNRTSLERKHRADRYRDQRDAMRCVAAEALLRAALGEAQVQVARSEAGKPYLLEHPDVFYNLSHSGKWVVLAIGDSEVGVDVEQIRGNTDIDRIAGRFFSREEQASLQTYPGEKRRRFFEIWTAKESYVKYLGTGLQQIQSCNVCCPIPGLHFYHRTLPEDYCLCLCTRDRDIRWEMADAQQLL